MAYNPVTGQYEEDQPAGGTGSVPAPPVPETAPPMPAPALSVPAHKVVEERQWSTRQMVPTAEAKRLRGEMAQAQDAEVEAAKKKGAAQVEMAKAQIDAADDIAAMHTEHEVRTHLVLEQTNREIAEAKARYQQRYDEWARADFKDYWADKSNKDKAVAGVAMALGVLGQVFRARAGQDPGENAALKTINAAMDRDAAMQKARIDKMAQAMEVARGDVSMAAAWKKGMLDDLALRQAAQSDAIASQIAQAKARAGVPLAQAEADETVAALRSKKAQILHSLHEKDAVEKTAQGQRQIISADERFMKGGAYKPPTESQAKAADFASRMAEDYATLRSVPPLSENGRRALQKWHAAEIFFEKNPLARMAAVKTGAYKTPEELLSENDRVAYAAGRRLATSALRGDSGAAIGVDEYLNWDRQHLPQPGEKDRDIQLKDRAIRRIIEGKAGAAQNPQAIVQQLPTGPRQAGGSGGAEPAPQAAHSAAVEWAKKNPNDPRAKRILEINGAR